MEARAKTEIFMLQRSSESRFSVSPSESPIMARKSNYIPNFHRKNVHWSENLVDICYIPSKDGFCNGVSRTEPFPVNRLHLASTSYPKSVLKVKEETNLYQNDLRREQDLCLVDGLLAELI